jgi:DNA repair protein SbcD/Mre11
MPETRFVEAFDVAVHGQGYATREITADLAAAYPAADGRLFHIGLLHTSLDGRPGHALYAPTSSQLLAQKGYHYWALGHVHKREVVSQDPWIVFPGNLQGRQAREIGPKGCTLVTVENGAVKHVEERPVDVLRWAVSSIDADGALSTGEVLDRVAHAIATEADRADGRALVVRVHVCGAVGCRDEIASDPDRWTQEVRALAAGVGSTNVWIEKVRFATERPTDLAQLARRDDAIGSLIRDIASAADDPAEIEALRASLADIRGILPRELLDGEDTVDPHSPETLAHMIVEARELLLARIARQGSAS